VGLVDQIPRYPHVEGDGRRFEGERGSKRLRIEGPAGVVDDERSIGAIAQSGPLVLEFWHRADRCAKASQAARRSCRDRQLDLVPRAERRHQDGHVDSEPRAERRIEFRSHAGHTSSLRKVAHQAKQMTAGVRDAVTLLNRLLTWSLRSVAAISTQNNNSVCLGTQPGSRCVPHRHDLDDVSSTLLVASARL